MKKQSILFLSVVCIFSMLFSSMALANEEMIQETEETVIEVAEIIGGQKYPTLKAAYDAAEEGATIKLLTSTSGEGIVITKAITIDFNNNTYKFGNDPVGSTGTETLGFQIKADVSKENNSNKVVLKNGTLTVDEAAKSKYAMLINNYTNLTIENMTLDGKNLDHREDLSYVLSNNSGKVEIIGNTNIYANDSTELAVAFDIYKYGDYAAPEVTVNTTGEINGTIEFSAESVEGKAKLAIEAGKFTEPILAHWCAEDVKPVINADGTFSVANTETLEDLVEINGQKYKTLTEAYDAAANGATIKFLRSGYGEGLKINKDITIDFSGETYSFSTPAVGSKGTETQGFQILKEHNVTLKNGTLEVNEKYEQSYAILIQNYSNLVIENMILDGTNLDRKIINPDKYGSYSYVLSNNCGTVIINGETDIIANDEGDEGKKIAFDVCKDPAYKAPEVYVLTTGKISGNIEVSESTTDAPKLEISNGIFTTPIQSAWCKEGFKPVVNDDGTYGVVAKTPFVKVGNNTYSSLTDAYNAAGDQDVITFFADGFGEGLVIDKNITIDFAGKTYTFTTPAVGSTGTESNGFQIKRDNAVKLVNGTLNVDEGYKEFYYILIQNYADLTLVDMKLDGTNLDKWSLIDGDSYTLSNNCGEILIAGKTDIIANDDGDKAFAFDVYDNPSYEGIPSVTVSTTGTISGNIEVSNGILLIKDGTYTMNVDEWCDTGLKAVQKDKLYIIAKEDTVAMINDVEYSSLADAYANAEANDTITLIANSEGAGIIITKPVTIDFAGYTYSFIAEAVGSTGTETLGFQIKKEVGENNTVVLKNGTLNVSESAKAEYAMLINNYANLTIESMTLDGTNLDHRADLSYVLSNNSGTVNITGETNIYANDSTELAVAFDVCKYADYSVPTVKVTTTGNISGIIEFLTESEDGGAKLIISDGTYTQELKESWCAEGYKPVVLDNNLYGVKKFLKVTFEANGGTLAEGTTEAIVFEDATIKTITRPADPTYEGYTFDGWYNGEIKWDFATSEVEESITLIAKWTKKAATPVGGGGGGGSSTPKFNVLLSSVKNATIERDTKTAEPGTTVTITVKAEDNYEVSKVSVVDSNKNEIKVTAKGNQYTFVMPEASVTVKVEMKEKDATTEETENSGEAGDFQTTFIDVDKDSVYYDAIAWAEETGVTKGTGSGKFSPERACTRAEILTALWRAADPQTLEGGETQFEDVDPNAYYAEAVAWAVKNGITKGTSETTFSPDRICTRAEIVTLIWRLAGEVEGIENINFTDVEIDSFYEEAVKWCVEEAITNGTSKTEFSPEEHCDRAQMVTFLYRFFN